MKKSYIISGLLLLLIGSFFMVRYFSKKDSYGALYLITSGLERPINIKSELGIDYGEYPIGKTKIMLSKNSHLLNLSSEGYSSTYISVDFSKADEITLEADMISDQKSQETLQALNKNYTKDKYARCSYFQNTWAICFSGDDIVILNKTSDNWSIISAGESVDIQNINSKAPTAFVEIIKKEDSE